MAEDPILVEAVYRANRRRCVRYALALEAAGIPFQIIAQSGESMIVVPAAQAAQAREELAAYEKDNHASPTVPIAVLEPRNGWPGVVGYSVVLLLLFFVQRHGAMGEKWFEAGMTNAGLIRQGEWWRAVTALTLHRDPAHLVGNMLFGSLIGLFAGRLLGSGLAWSGIVLAGAAGNLLNAWVRDARHTSVGASTAVFAAFGMVAAFAAIRRRHIRPTKFARYTPIVGGVILLSYLGTSGERTDVFAHVAGFLAGLLLGAWYGKSGDKIMATGARTQVLFGIGTVAFLGLMWIIALSSV